MPEMRQRLIVACDMGATSTKALLGDLSGEVFKEVSGEGFNLRQGEPYDVGVVLAELVRLLYLASKFRPDDPAGIGIGIAGAGAEDARAEVKRILKLRWPNSRIIVHHDAFIAQYGAFEGGPGVLLTSGTGSIAYGRNSEGREARAGGWGWMLGDDGSGWWIGREVVREVLFAHESGTSTELTSLLLDEFGVDEPYGLFPIAYRDDFNRGRISNLAAHVPDLAEKGDEAAQRIMRQAGQMLGETAVRVAQQLNLPNEDLLVAMLGSVCEGGGWYLREGIRSALHEYAGGETGLLDSESAFDAEGEMLPAGVARKREHPPTDLTLEKMVGPRLVKPYENALHGAAAWIRDTLLKEKFA